MPEAKTFTLGQSLQALDALRQAAGLPPEQFPIQAFVGMISDEIEVLRRQGRTDAEIARLIADHSDVLITPEEIAENYASPEERGARG